MCAFRSLLWQTLKERVKNDSLNAAPANYIFKKQIKTVFTTNLTLPPAQLAAAATELVNKTVNKTGVTSPLYK